VTIPKHLIVFCKVPVPGRVKTRLALDIGNENACRVHEHLVRRLQSFLSKTDFIVWWYSDGSWPEMEACYGDRFRLQSGNDLGEKMYRALVEVQSISGTNPVLIGSDCPDIDEPTINKAFQAVEKYDVVFGPSLDGGYYLVGITGQYPFLFSGIRWSSSDVLKVSLQKCHMHKISVSLVDTLKDIDEYCDLLRSSIYPWYQKEIEKK
jgi:rSAM/selenodomain-associated transferase 1